jgi:hypothetical protein
LAQHLLSESLGQVFRCQDVDADAKQPLGFELEGCECHERGMWGRLDQQVQVAIFVVIAPKDGAEDARTKR